MDKDTATQIVFSAIDVLNEQVPQDAALEKSPDAVLLGRGSKLDSLGMVGLIVEVEQGIAEEFDIELTLADEKAMSRESSPFRTVDTLAEYIVWRLEQTDA